MRPSLPRRHFLQAGALGTLGLTLPDLLRTEALAKPGRGKSGPKSCIYLFLYGGPSQIDLWDMKPAAPEEFRGEFKPVATSVPGVQVCEHLPRTAKLAKHFTIVRTLTHANKNHNPAGAWMLTGLNPKSDNAGQLAPKPDDPPALGSLAARLAPGKAGVPSFVMLPARMFDQGANLRGQTAGWLGPAYDPLLIAQDPSSSRFRMDMYEQRDDLPPDRLQARRDLLKALDRKSPGQSEDAEMGEFQQRAFDLLNGARGRSAFDLSAEPASVRDRYGRTTFGQGCLLARRLVEAGARLVTVSDTTPAGHHQWDTHSNNFLTLKNKLLP